MITTPRIDGIRQQSIPVVGSDLTLLSTVAITLLSAEVWKVDRNGAAERIGTTIGKDIGKIDSASPSYLRDGTVRLTLSCADVGASGSTSHFEYFDFPNAIPPPSADDYNARGGVKLVATAGTRFAQAIKVACDALITALAPLVPPG